MSQCSPSLQRWMDNGRPEKLPKLLHKTFLVPFGPPSYFNECIRPEQRKRVDLVPSYASSRQHHESGNMYPIHDATNVLEVLGDGLPLLSLDPGFYEIHVPEKMDPVWCSVFKPGERRVAKPHAEIFTTPEIFAMG